MIGLNLTVALLGVTILFGAGGSADNSPDPGTVALATRVRHFDMQDGTVLDGISQLSTESVDLSFSFEEALRAKFSDPPVPQWRFGLRLDDHTIVEILDALCSKDVNYVWAREGLTINVYPRATADDSSYLPNRRLSEFDVRRVTDAEQAVFAAVAQLPSPFEQIACAQAGSDTSYPVPWDAAFRDLTVRQAFNLIARHLGARGGWLLAGSQDFRTIGFHRGRIHYSSRQPGSTE